MGTTDAPGTVPITVWLIDAPASPATTGIRERLLATLDPTAMNGTDVSPSPHVEITEITEITDPLRQLDWPRLPVTPDHRGHGGGHGPAGHEARRRRPAPYDAACGSQPESRRGDSLHDHQPATAHRPQTRPEVRSGAVSPAHSPAEGTATATTDPKLDRNPDRTPAESSVPTDDRPAAVPPAPTRTRCVLLDARRVATGPEDLARLTATLGPHDVLAVLTLGHRDGRQLHDPRPALVTAASAAGLEHLQHIVTVRRAQDRPHIDGDSDVGSDAPGAGQHGDRDGDGRDWALGPDLSLFRRTRPPRPVPDNTRPANTRPGDTAPGDTGPGCGSALRGEERITDLTEQEPQR